MPWHNTQFFVVEHIFITKVIQKKTTFVAHDKGAALDST